MDEMGLKEVLTIFWHRKIRILFITAIFIALGVGYTYKLVEPEYTSSTTLVLTTSQEETKKGTNTITTTDITLNSKLISTYSELLKSKNVIRQVISNLGIDIQEEELRKNITVNSVKDTELIKISVTSKSPFDASKIANEMAKVFTEKVSEIYNINNVHIVDEAEINTDPSNINNVRDIVIFGVIGASLAMISALISNILDTTIKTAEDVEKQFKIPVVASTPLYEFNTGKKENDKIKKELVVQKNPKSPISEIFRTLRTNIQFMNTSKKLRTLLVTSTFPGEGKSWISSNLAVTFAQAGKRVILIDADMRKGRLYTIFGISPRPGLSNILTEMDEEGQNDIDIGKYIQETEIKNLLVIPAGNIPPNPSELLVSVQMRRLLDILRTECDIIIIDGTPCELVTDSVILSRVVDSSIIVTAYKDTKKDCLEKSLKSIQNVGGKLAGVVINKMPVSVKKYNENYYYEETISSEIEETKNTDNQELDNKDTEIKIINDDEKTVEKQQMNNEEKETHQQTNNNEEILEKPKLLENSEDLEKLKKTGETATILDEKTSEILNQINSYLDQEKKNLN